MRTDPHATVGPDARSLDALRRDAAANPRAAARQAAVQFESLFMQMVVKSMRDASPKPADAGAGGDTFGAMLDQQFARQSAGRQGGLADMLEKQLTRHMQAIQPAPDVPPLEMPSASGLPPSANQSATGMPPLVIPPLAAQHFPAPPALTPAAAPASTPTAQVVQALPPAGAPTSLRDRASSFVRDMLPHAKAAERATGVPASFILGQAALESGWGRGEIRNADGSSSFNLFGIKATAKWGGAATQQMTTEYEGGQPIRQRAAFRSYGSYAEAFTDYARMLAGSPRYAGVVKGAATAEEFAGGMQRAGYATDPQYATKLARTIHTTLALQRAMG